MAQLKSLLDIYNVIEDAHSSLTQDVLGPFGETLAAYNLDSEQDGEEATEGEPQSPQSESEDEATAEGVDVADDSDEEVAIGDHGEDDEDGEDGEGDGEDGEDGDADASEGEGEEENGEEANEDTEEVGDEEEGEEEAGEVDDGENAGQDDEEQDATYRPVGEMRRYRRYVYAEALVSSFADVRDFICKISPSQGHCRNIVRLAGRKRASPEHFYRSQTAVSTFTACVLEISIDYLYSNQELPRAAES